MTDEHPMPRGELSLRTVAMPADTNPAGDIFGGWIMSLMDLAAGVAASSLAKGRVATAAVSNLSFLRPVKVGDVVCVYTDLSRTGRTSITMAVETWVLRQERLCDRRVGNGTRRAILKINRVWQDAASLSRQCVHPFACVHETSPVKGKNCGTAMGWRRLV